MKKIKKTIYIDNSSLMELISDITHKVVVAKFGEECLVLEEEVDCMIYTEEAQDFFNETYDEIENMFDTTCGIMSDREKPTPRKGDEVTIAIPFTYTLGEESYMSGKVLNTVEDCINEVYYELENGFPYGDEPYLEVL